VIGSRLREQTGERSQVLDHRNAALNAFVSVGGKRYKGKPQADAAKDHYRSLGEIGARGFKARLETKAELHACKILRIPLYLEMTARLSCKILRIFRC
jgi:hypothetical protein